MRFAALETYIVKLVKVFEGFSKLERITGVKLDRAGHVTLGVAVLSVGDFDLLPHAKFTVLGLHVANFVRSKSEVIPTNTIFRIFSNFNRL